MLATVNNNCKLLSVDTNRCTSTVTDFASLPDPVATDGISHGRGGLVGEAATEIEGCQPSLEVSSAAAAPLGGRGGSRDCRHDASLRRISACAGSCVCA